MLEVTRAERGLGFGVWGLGFREDSLHLGEGI